jgi:hypothetical protein
MSLHETEAAGAANAKAPRVSLDDIKKAIDDCYYLTGDRLLPHAKNRRSLAVLTLCFAVMKNGFVVIGKSAPASPENFDAELGRQFAYEDAVRQIWPLMGYALKERLTQV